MAEKKESRARDREARSRSRHGCERRGSGARRGGARAARRRAVRAVIDALSPGGRRRPISAPSASPASRCASRRIASPTATTSCAWCCAGRRSSATADLRSRHAAQGNDVWTARIHAARAGALSLHRDRPGSITSNRGAGNSSGATILPTSGSRLQVGSALICARPRRARRRRRCARPRRTGPRCLRESRDAAIDRGRGLAQGARARSGARRADAAPRGPPPRRVGRARDLSRTASARASAAGTSCFRAPLPRSRRGTATSATSRRACPMSPSMGFDVLYLPPIQPIGRVNRKGAQQCARCAGPTTSAAPGRSAPPRAATRTCCRELGTLEDFRHLLATARELGIEIALDIAFQCAPDHPYVRDASRMVQASARRQRAIRGEPAEEIPGHLSVRFRERRLARPVGRAEERRRVLDRAGRADISRRQSAHQAVRVLGMAHRRDQARDSRRDLPRRGVHAAEGHAPAGEARLHAVVHLLHLAQHQARAHRVLHRTRAGPGREYFRPNVWPNTPDILHETLQSGVRAVFAARLVLAATLSANYGIYGPTFELMESTPREPGSEEYRDSEKYQLRHWTSTVPTACAR